MVILEMADGGRNITLTAGIYSLVQGFAWSLISIFYVAVYDCYFENPLIQYTDNSVNIYTLFYASYFNGSTCKDGGPKFNEILEPAPSSIRTYHWMVRYAIISSLWMPVSILLIVSAVYKLKGSCYYIPWLIVSLSVTIADASAVVWYSIDISKTLSADEYVKFLGANGTWKEVTGVDAIQHDTAAPAVIMTLFFSRFVIFWFLNISLIYHCIRECLYLKKSNIQGSISSEDIMNDERFRSWNRPTINHLQLNLSKEELTKSKEIENTPTSSNNNRSRKNGISEVNINEKRNTIHGDNPPIKIYPHKTDLRLEESKTNPKVMYKVDEFGIPIEEIRIPRVSNSQNSSVGTDTPIGSPVFDYLGRPARPPQLRRGESVTSGSEQAKPRSITSQELRGQAPWSYLHPSLPSSQTPPTIPSPDYADNQQPSLAHSRQSPVKRKPSNRRVHGLQ